MASFLNSIALKIMNFLNSIALKMMSFLTGVLLKDATELLREVPYTTQLIIIIIAHLSS